MISASIDDSYFLSESDKLNFYREIESLNTREDLHSLKESFFHNISDIPESAKNLFLLLETQIVAQTYNISSITRIGTNYQIEFFPDTSLETLKSFLSLDIDTRFQVISATKMRTAIKGFENDRIFIEYVLSLVENTI